MHDIGNCLAEQLEDLSKSERVYQCPNLDELIQPVIFKHENDCFMAVLSGDEVFEVVRKMNLIKAPRPDGMPARFFQKYWCIVCHEVVRLVQNAFLSGIIPKSIN